MRAQDMEMTEQQFEATRAWLQEIYRQMPAPVRPVYVAAIGRAVGVPSDVVMERVLQIGSGSDRWLR